MESAEQPTRDLHLKASESLTKADHPATPQSVNPNDDSLRESIERDVRHFLMGSTNDRATKGWIPVLIGCLRRRIKK